MTAQEALAAVLAGQTVRVVNGTDPDDPICLHYLDRCFEFDFEPMIYTEAIGGWSEGIKEAICGPNSLFYVEFLADPPPSSIALHDETPLQRESDDPVVLTVGKRRSVEL